MGLERIMKMERYFKFVSKMNPLKMNELHALWLMRWGEFGVVWRNERVKNATLE